MTGQVKEDILAGQRELGVVVEDGRLTIEPALVIGDEFLTAPAVFSYRDVHDRTVRAGAARGRLALTFCQVPVVIHRAGPARIEITTERRGHPRTSDGLALDGPTSAQIFGRTGAVRRLDVHLGLDACRKLAADPDRQRGDEARRHAAAHRRHLQADAVAEDAVRAQRSRPAGW